MSSSETDDSSGKQTANSAGSWRDSKELKKFRARSRRLSSASVQSLPCGTVTARRTSQSRVSQIKLEERKSVSRETEHERTILRCAHLSASCDELCLDCITGPSEAGATTPNCANNCAFASDADGEVDADDDSVSSAISASTSFASADSFVRRSRSLSFASRSVSPSLASCSSPVRVGVASSAFGFCQSPTGNGRVPSPFASHLGSRISSSSSASASNRLSQSSRREPSPFQGGLVALAPSSLVQFNRSEPSSFCCAPTGTTSGSKCFSPVASQYNFAAGFSAASPYSPSQLHPPSPLAAALPTRPATVSSPSQPATPSRSASPASSGYLSSQSTNPPQTVATSQTGTVCPVGSLNAPAAVAAGCASQCSPSTHRYRTSQSHTLTLLPSRLDDVVSARRISLKRKFDELVASAGANADVDLTTASRTESAAQPSPVDFNDAGNVNSDGVQLQVASAVAEVEHRDSDVDPISASDCGMKESVDELLLMVAPTALLDAQEEMQDGVESHAQLEAKRCRKNAAE